MEYIPAKTIVTRTKSTGWFGADYNMNIYRGCSHGCIYCDSRSDCYRNPDFFGTVKPKADALAIIRDDLRRKVRSGIVATGAMSDPYNPFEKNLELTRHALELVNAYGFGVSVDTKSSLVTRDIDIFSEIKTHSPVNVKLTITTTDPGVAKFIEPSAHSPDQRFDAVEQLAAAGIFCGVLFTPVLPFITDTPENVREVVRRASECGARFVYSYLSMTLRDGMREYFYEKLDEGAPGLKEKYIARYGTRYNCLPPNHRELTAVLKMSVGARDFFTEWRT